MKLMMMRRRPGVLPGRVTAAAAPGVDLRRDGDPTFNITSLDNTTLYEGATARTWYQRLLNALATAYVEPEFNQDSWVNWNRTGKAYVNTYLRAFRVTGDLALLDECARLFEIAWANRNASGVWTNLDDPLEWNLASGLIGVLTYTLERNRALTSPLYGAGGYGTLADKYWTWIGGTLIPHMRHTTTPAPGLPIRPPNVAGGQSHAWCAFTAFHWYVGRTLDLRGGTLADSTANQWKAEAQSMLTDVLHTHVTGITSYNDRTVRLYNHLAVDGWGIPTTGDRVQYTTYHSGEVDFYHDMFIEGLDSRINLTLLTQLANGFSDLVCDDDTNIDPLARTLAGDRVDGETVLGLTVNMTYRSRVNKERTVRSVFPLLAPLDTKDHIRPYLWAYYPYAGTVESPQYPMYPACAIWIINDTLL